MPARIQTRQDLIDYTLRRLGHPVIQINVTPDQIDDRLDDALHKFAEYHFNGTLRQHYKHQITQDDRDNGYIVLPENIIGVVNIYPMQGYVMMGADMFNIRYQIALNDLYTLSGTNLVPYYMTMTHLNVINEMLVGQTPIRYTRRYGNRLYIDTDWKEMMLGNYIVVECFEVVDPEEYEGVYDEQWLKDYFTALVQEQWGSNLSKFTGMPLPGGLVLNGSAILQEAKENIAKAEQDLENRYMLMPLDRMA